MTSKLIPSRIKQFALAGNATITLQSGETGDHITYKITRHKENNDLYFIKLLSGPDNEEDYTYIGCYYADNNYFNPCKTYKNTPNRYWPKSLRVISYFLNNINKIPSNLYVYHEGKCGCCGRKLTTPESIERGYGPECYRRIDV